MIRIVDLVILACLDFREFRILEIFVSSLECVNYQF